MFEKSLIAAAMLLCTGGSASAAEDPGSLLVFPVWNNQEGFITLLTVTNTSTTRDVILWYTYFEGESCQAVDFWVPLSPLDTFSCLTRAHNLVHPNGKGYVHVHARSPQTFEPLRFDNLVGTSLIIDGLSGGSYAVNPFVFQGVGDGDVNGNGRLDLDGVEYTKAPGKIIFPRFLGQPSNFSTSNLILIDAAGGAGWFTRVDLLIFNDNEEMFTASRAFRCWEEIGLLELSQIFSTDFLKFFTNHDPDEIYGYPDVESGWFTVTGDGAYKEGVGVVPNPAILAVLIEPTTNLQSAAAPFQVGQRDNGSFYFID